MCQDKDGYLWFITETGVSRFDGHRFVNYSVQDGLPDNDILFLFCDSRNRVWFSPFKNALAYYYKGKIYNQTNDPLLKRIHLQGFVEYITEDADGNLIFFDKHALYIISGNQITVLDTIDNNPCYKYASIGRDSTKHLTISFVQHLSCPIYRLDKTIFYRTNLAHATPTDRNFSLLLFSENFRIELQEENKLNIYSYSEHRSHVIQAPANIISYSILNRDSIAINTHDGSLCYSFRNNAVIKTFLQGRKVSCALIDDEDNLWFTTLNDGVFKFSARQTQNYTFSDHYGHEVGVNVLFNYGKSLYIGTNIPESIRYVVEQNKFYFESFLQSKLVPPNTDQTVSCIEHINDKEILFGTNHALIRFDASHTITQYARGVIKATIRKNSDELLVGTYRELLLLDSKTLTTKKKLFSQRVTALHAISDSVFIGTLNGLYLLAPGENPQFLGHVHPAFTRRIASIVSTINHGLWIATHDSGVVQWFPGKSIKHFTTKQGLSSNTCRTLYAHNNQIWIGTNKGVSQLIVNANHHTVNIYNTSHGILSDMVNSIWATDSTVYIGTSKGLAFFNPSQLTQFSKCRLIFAGAYVNTKPQPLSQRYNFSYPFNKNIRFDFSAISLKATGDVTYQYYLEGYDERWQSTPQNVVEYLSLPGGTYTLKIKAINSLGKSSNVLTIPFTIRPPFWETVWFQLLFLLASIVAIGGLVYGRLKYVQRRTEEKNQLKEKVMLLEQKVLQAQMNPHFIFNCLNSIQKYVLEKDVLLANKYLHLFAKLIRQTLDLSVHNSISIEEEIMYLRNYLDLEKMRFGDKFDFKIQMEPQASRLRIPGMILQPFVENSIRHGIRYKENGTGMITIGIKTDATHLRCIIEDNGVGRQQAQMLKSLQHIEYQSRGMNLTAERIQAINRSHVDRSAQITIEVVDLEDELKMPCGTRVCIGFPLTILQSFA
jgi:ligand-binding sensor domain-containing protein/uncharacterized membrane protein